MQATIQKSATKAEKEEAVREHNTWKSSAFSLEETKPLATRNQNTFNSTVFGSATQNPTTRIKLGGDSHGTSALFGSDQAEYYQSSRNGFIQAPPEQESKKQAENKANTYSDAMTMKAKELYGKTVQQYGLHQNKRDGALMA